MVSPLRIIFLLLILAGLCFLAILNLGPAGSLHQGAAAWTPAFKMIVWEYRFPMAVTAFCAGGSLAVSGLLMQTLFANPLAGPDILGMSGGQSLGVCAWLLMVEHYPQALASFATLGPVLSSCLGGMMVLACMLVVLLVLNNVWTLLIVGLLWAHFCSGLINVLISFSQSEQIKLFYLWGMGSFQNVARAELPLFVGAVLVGLSLAFLFSQKLDAFLLGEDWAQSLGVSRRQTYFGAFLATGLLSGVVTAFCGPIAFLGVMAPHFGRKLLRTENHCWLIPGCFVVGGLIAMIATLVAGQMSDMSLPLPINSLFGFLGAPLLGWYLWKMHRHD